MDDSILLKWILFIISISLLYYLIFKPYFNNWKNNLLVKKALQEKWKPEIKFDKWENSKLSSLETPKDHEIELYYKMYCKKWELDHEHEWTTIDPLTLEEFKRQAKKKYPQGGYRYIISKTMDTFMGGFNSPHLMMRYNDYRKMVEEEENTN